MAKNKKNATANNEEALRVKCEAVGINFDNIPWAKIGTAVQVFLELLQKYLPKKTTAKDGCEDDHASLQEALVKNFEVGCAIAKHLEDCCEPDEESEA